MRTASAKKRERNDDWAGPLRRAGLRSTRPRRLVLDLMRSMRGHHSADELVLALRNRGTPLGRTSVYNVVSDLAACGLLTLTDVGPGRARYEFAERRHHHFVCRRCGKILDIPCVSESEPCLHPPRFAGHVDEAQVILRGTCPDCLSSARPLRSPRPR
jgi:Fe2+ or Zn2+ uptake regulation protein